MDRYLGQLGTDVFGVTADEKRVAGLHWTKDQACAADADGVHAAINGGTSAKEITADITAPPCPRNLTVTPGGTTADVAAGEVVITGTDMAGNVISESFTFAADASAAVSGVKAFATVDKIAVPAQDGTGCTFTVGFGSALGLPFRFDTAPFVMAMLGGVIETSAPTVAADADEIAENTLTLSGTLDGDKAVDVYFIL